MSHLREDGTWICFICGNDSHHHFKVAKRAFRQIKNAEDRKIWNIMNSLGKLIVQITIHDPNTNVDVEHHFRFVRKARIMCDTGKKETYYVVQFDKGDAESFGPVD